MGRPNAARRSASARAVGPWGSGLATFQRRLDGLDADLLPAVAALAYESIVFGSSVTGAPGQPEASGDLIESWTQDMVTPTEAAVVTASPYALQNETGVRVGGGEYTQRSAVGGRFSVALTRRNFQPLVDVAAAQVVSEAAA